MPVVGVGGDMSKNTLDRLEEAMAWHCREGLSRCGGNISRAAGLLGIQRATLRKYLRVLKFDNEAAN